MSVIYIQMRDKVVTSTNTALRIRDIATIFTDSEKKSNIENIVIHYVTNQEETYIVIDSRNVTEAILTLYPDIEITFMQATETIVYVEKSRSIVQDTMLFVLVWIVLFIGTATTIINFHYDVSMLEVHQKLHLILTGQEETFPLWIQIPYSFGLAVGMIIFLNRFFTKRFNNEPSPLEIEVFKYQKDIEQFIASDTKKIDRNRKK